MAKEFQSLGLRLHADTPHISYVFIKHHKPKEGEAEVPNALYVAGLPLGLDEVSLEAVFSVFGHVANVVLHPSKVCCARDLGGAVVYIVVTVMLCFAKCM
jgi:hypothetical protein